MHISQVAQQAGAYPSLTSRKQLGIFLLPQDGLLVHCMVTPSIKFASTHLYIWEEKGNMRVKCLTPEHNTSNRTDSSRVKCTIHEATKPPYSSKSYKSKTYLCKEIWINKSSYKNYL